MSPHGCRVQRSARRPRGVSLFEWLIVVAVFGTLVALALPSLVDHLARRAVEGVALELLADLQYARSEATQRSEAVAVTAGSGCHVVHLASADAGCDADDVTISPPTAALKSVVHDSRPAVRVQALDGLAQVIFESAGSTASFTGPASGTDAAAWEVADAGSTLVVRVQVNRGGRASACVRAGQLPGIPGCAP